MDVPAFALAAICLLAIPGPTNTLLATSGGSVGAARSLHLLVAGLAGYAVSVLLLRIVFGPVLQAIPPAQSVLRGLIFLYLIHLAMALWRDGADASADTAPISGRRVLVATLLNPKAVIIAFTLLPSRMTTLDFAMRLALLGVLIAAIGAAWIVVGAWLARGLRGAGHPRLAYRLGAAALMLLAGIVGLQSLAIV